MQLALHSGLRVDAVNPFLTTSPNGLAFHHRLLVLPQYPAKWTRWSRQMVGNDSAFKNKFLPWHSILSCSDWLKLIGWLTAHNLLLLGHLPIAGSVLAEPWHAVAWMVREGVFCLTKQTCHQCWRVEGIVTRVGGWRGLSPVLEGGGDCHQGGRVEGTVTSVGGDCHQCRRVEGTVSSAGGWRGLSAVWEGGGSVPVRGNQFYP